MKILHIAETTKGGIASYLFESLPSQVAEFGEGKVGILLPNSHKNFLPKIEGLKVFTFTRERRGILSVIKLVIASFKALKSSKVDVIFLHSTFAGISVRTLLLFWPYKVKIVYCSHGWSFNIKTSKWKQSIYVWLEKLLANLKTDKIVCISEYERSSAVKAGFPINKLKLIYNGIAVKATPSKVEKSFSGHLNILYVGRLDSQKGIDTLVKALQNIPEYKWNLTIIGSAVNNNILYEIPANATQIEWIERKGLEDYYAAADVLIVPSRWEAFGLVALEAMNNSTAVFSSDAGGLPEIVKPRVNGEVFPVGDYNALTNLLISTTKDKLHIMGKAGYIMAREKFSAAKMNNKTNDILKELLK